MGFPRHPIILDKKLCASSQEALWRCSPPKEKTDPLEPCNGETLEQSLHPLKSGIEKVLSPSGGSLPCEGEFNAHLNALVCLKYENHHTGVMKHLIMVLVELRDSHL